MTTTDSTLPLSSCSPNSSSLKDAEPTDAIETPESTEIIYPTNARLAILLLTLCTVALSVGLNNTILTTAIPSIASSFSSLSDVGWYGSAFFLPETALQPVYGKLYTFFNTKHVYLVSLTLFQIGLVVCATANASATFILGRAISGIGGAGLLAGGIDVISHLTVREKRSTLMSAVMSLNVVSSSCGPILGGALTKLGWRWCFWAILPLNVIGSVLIFLLFKPTYTHEKEKLSLNEKTRILDLPGCFLLVSSVLSLLLALHFGSTMSWSHTSVLVTLVLSPVLLVAFLISQSLAPPDAETIPSSIICRRTVWASCGLGFSLNMGANNHLFFLPYYFQVIRGLSPSASGIRIVPYFVGITFCAALSGIFHRKIGYYNPFMLAGSCLFLAGSCLIYTLQISTSRAACIGFELLSGCGIGLSNILTVIAVHTVLPESQHQVATAVVIMLQLMGGAVSASLSNTIFVKELIQSLRDVPGMTSVETKMITGDPITLRSFVPAGQLDSVLAAFMKALDKTFIVAIAAAACAVIFATLEEWVPVITDKREDEKNVGPRG